MCPDEKKIKTSRISIGNRLQKIFSSEAPKPFQTNIDMYYSNNNLQPISLQCADKDPGFSNMICSSVAVSREGNSDIVISDFLKYKISMKASRAQNRLYF